METPQIKKRIKELEADIIPQTTTEKVKLFMQENKVYVGIAIVTLLSLVILRPTSVTVIVRNKAVISYKKVFLYWILISLLLSACYYAYLARKG